MNLRGHSLMRRAAGRWLGLLLACNASGALATTPGFGDHPAQPVYRGTTATPVLRTAQDKRYRTMIRTAASGEKVNFAGHYILSAFGCGSSCLQVFALDARSGEVHWLPFTVSWGPEDTSFDTGIMPLDYRADSTLLVVAGSRNEHGHGIYRYVFEHGQFRLQEALDVPGAQAAK